MQTICMPLTACKKARIITKSSRVSLCNLLNKGGLKFSLELQFHSEDMLIL